MGTGKAMESVTFKIPAIPAGGREEEGDKETSMDLKLSSREYGITAVPMLFARTRQEIIREANF